MTRRLQVLFEDAELGEIRRAARRRRMTVAEWVRQALRTARATESAADPGQKLEVIRAATRHSFPTADIDQLLADIERGYLGEGGS